MEAYDPYLVVDELLPEHRNSCGNKNSDKIKLSDHGYVTPYRHNV